MHKSIEDIRSVLHSNDIDHFNTYKIIDKLIIYTVWEVENK